MKDAKEQMQEAVYVFIRDNQGVKGGKICEAVGKEAGNREVDRTLQKLRKDGQIAFQNGGWYATEEE